jgi:hypothetical protein
MTFEDPTALARCIKSDCQAYRAGNTPLCAKHLREQEVAAGAKSISEPDLEAKARAAGERAVAEMYVGPDPDTNGDPLRIHVPSWDEKVGITPEMRARMPERPDPTELEPHWDGTQWVLREKRSGPDLKAIRSLVRELMHELNIPEAEGALE